MPDPLTPLTYALRTGPFQESVIREMTRLGDETGAINLSQGLPDFDSPPAVLEAAVAAIHRGDNQYTFPFGAPEFREAIARKTRTYNHIAADPDRRSGLLGVRRRRSAVSDPRAARRGHAPPGAAVLLPRARQTRRRR